MATFTIRLKDAYKDQGGTFSIDTGVAVLSNPEILGLNFYPLFSDLNGDPNTPGNPDYRPILNGKIFDHYQNQEIGYESIGLFRLGLRRKMNEIMPFYNQLYKSEALTINPISTIDIDTTNSLTDSKTITANATTTATSTASSGARAVSSDTPQTMLSDSEDYASGATDNNSSATNNSSGTNEQTNTTSDTVTSTNNVSGYQGSPSDLLIRFRETFINIDMMVIEDIDSLFMGLWDNADEYFNHHDSGMLYPFYLNDYGIY